MIGVHSAAERISIEEVLDDEFWDDVRAKTRQRIDDAGTEMEHWHAVRKEKLAHIAKGKQTYD